MNRQHRTPLPELLRLLQEEPNNPRIAELYEHCLTVARWLITDRDLPDDREDLAGDLLVHLHDTGNTQIQTLNGLRAELSKFLIERESPAAYELWSVMSEAIRELAGNGRVGRLDAPATDRNSNAAVWVLSGHGWEERKADMSAFRQRCAGIGIGPYKQGEGSRVLPLPQSRALLESMLECAEAPLLFKQLFDQACSMVELFRAVPFPTHGDDEEQDVDLPGESDGREGLRRPIDEDFLNPELVARGDDSDSAGILPLQVDYDIMVREEARWRAAQVWAETCEDGNTGVLCDYVLPKFFHERSDVKLEDFGDPRRVGERTKMAMLTLRKYLGETVAQGSLAGEAEYRRYLGRVCKVMGDILREKCQEEGCGTGFCKGEGKDPSESRGER